MTVTKTKTKTNTRTSFTTRTTTADIILTEHEGDNLRTGVPVRTGGRLEIAANSPAGGPGTTELVIGAPGAHVTACLSGGIVNDVFWPSPGQQLLGQIGFLVVGPDWSCDISGHGTYRIDLLDSRMPFATVVHDVHGGDLELQTVVDPDTDALAIHYRLRHHEPCQVALVLHTARSAEVLRTDTSGCERTLCISTGFAAMAVVADSPIEAGSCALTEHRPRPFPTGGTSAGGPTEGGVVVEPLPATHGTVVIGFGATCAEAVHLADLTLTSGRAGLQDRYIGAWRSNVAASSPIGNHGVPGLRAACESSEALLRVHLDPLIRNRSAAPDSVSIGPSAKATERTSFDHVSDRTSFDHVSDRTSFDRVSDRTSFDRVSDRTSFDRVSDSDAIDAAFGFLAVDRADVAFDLLVAILERQPVTRPRLPTRLAFSEDRLTVRHVEDAALLVILAAKLAEAGALDLDGEKIRVGLRACLQFITATGPAPAADQERRVPTGSVSPRALSAAITALRAASLLDILVPFEADYALSLAHDWERRIDEWTYVEGTELDFRYGTEGHYQQADGSTGLDFLALVRFGLRTANDPRIISTLCICDGEFASAIGEYGYYRTAEHSGSEAGLWADGSTVIRACPVLTAQRGTYETLAGGDSAPWLRAILASLTPGGLIPDTIVGTVRGAPAPESSTGSHPSSYRLLPAHAELLKLAGARRTLRSSEFLRCISEPGTAALHDVRAVAHWRSDLQVAAVAADTTVIVEAGEPFTLQVGVNGWFDVEDIESKHLGLGRHGVTLEATALFRSFEFTRRWQDGTCETHEHRLEVLPKPRTIGTHGIRATRSLAGRTADRHNDGGPFSAA